MLHCNDEALFFTTLRGAWEKHVQSDGRDPHLDLQVDLVREKSEGVADRTLQTVGRAAHLLVQELMAQKQGTGQIHGHYAIWIRLRKPCSISIGIVGLITGQVFAYLLDLLHLVVVLCQHPHVVLQCLFHLFGHTRSRGLVLEKG